jgi:hypothetical protein
MAISDQRRPAESLGELLESMWDAADKSSGAAAARSTPWRRPVRRRGLSKQSALRRKVIGELDV